VSFALFAEIAQAEEALDRLTAEAFRSSDISVLLRDARGTRLNTGTLGLLSDFGMLDLAGSDSVIAAGPIRQRLIAGARSAGPGVPGALLGLGLSPYDSVCCAIGVDAGSILLAVDSDAASAARAQEIMKGSGAMRIASGDEQSADCSHARQGTC
jgi:hypothetical protein